MASASLRTQAQARALALKRRLSLFFTGGFDPYPQAPDGVSLSPSRAHFSDYGEAPLKLSWRRAGIGDAGAWQAAARAKLAELTGHRRRDDAPVARHEDESQLGPGLRRRALYLRVAADIDVPVNLVWSPADAGPRPVMLCLHGHNSGAHLSWGETRMPADPLKIAEGADYARQAAARGYLAVCVEQSCFGERREREMRRRNPAPCADAANHALLLGRTLLGERTSDVSSVVDWVAGGGAGIEVDLTRLHAMGNSTGGDVAVYAAALDPRITGVIASGCVGLLRDTTGRHNACPDAIVPGVLNWLEYDDVLALIAPRPLLAISGVRDHIYPFARLETAVAGAKAVYAALGAESNLRAASGPGGHRFYPELTWPKFLDLVAAATA